VAESEGASDVLFRIEHRLDQNSAKLYNQFVLRLEATINNPAPWFRGPRRKTRMVPGNG